ncbi:hypothetical protein ACLOJK_029471 [Asimina triloba]
MARDMVRIKARKAKKTSCQAEALNGELKQAHADLERVREEIQLVWTHSSPSSFNNEAEVKRFGFPASKGRGDDNQGGLGSGEGGVCEHSSKLWVAKEEWRKLQDWLQVLDKASGNLYAASTRTITVEEKARKLEAVL